MAKRIIQEEEEEEEEEDHALLLGKFKMLFSSLCKKFSMFNNSFIVPTSKYYPLKSRLRRSLCITSTKIQNALF